MGFREQWPLELGVNEWREAALKSAAKNLPPVLALRRVDFLLVVECRS